MTMSTDTGWDYTVLFDLPAQIRRHSFTREEKERRHDSGTGRAETAGDKKRIIDIYRRVLDKPVAPWLPTYLRRL